MDRVALQQSVAGSMLAQSLLWRAGAAVAVVEGDEVQTVMLGRGLDADTPVEVGSVTKPFTGLLLAEAVLRGELTLGSRVDEVVFSERWEGTPAVTAGELAAQVSGLPRLSLPVPQRLHLDPYAAYSRQDLEDYLRRRQPRSPSAPQYQYSNLGFAVLG